MDSLIDQKRSTAFNLKTMKEFSSDTEAVVKHIRSTSNLSSILVGHSNGGGQCQSSVSALPPNTFSGLVHLAPSPPTGNLSIFLAWLRLDWLFVPRAIWHKGDIMNPVSIPELVRKAFFCDGYGRGDNSGELMEKFVEVDDVILRGLCS
ncbi:hypothetical protein PM082_005905 [Marasmius tenuissimus]|nr:hypothetical protein PM082_005905 [Marasmius tenuissimus]